MAVIFLPLWKVVSLLFCSVSIAKWGLAWGPGIQLRKHPWSSALTSRRICGSLPVQSSASMKNNNDRQNQLLSKGRLSTPFKNLEILMEPMIVYFESMVDPDTSRFFLFSYPQSPTEYISASSIASQAPSATQTSLKSHAHCPLRDLGSAWDACKAVKVLRHCYHGEQNHDLLSANLVNAILQTINYYSSSLEAGDLHLSPELLKEIPKISHNALLLLGLTSLEDLGLFEASNVQATSVEVLTLGILSMQRPDGAFATEFCRQKSGDDGDGDDDVYIDIAFCPGQAMTALMEVYFHPGLLTETTMDQIFSSMLSAFQFYRDYYMKEREDNNINVNYSIWQVQTFARLSSTLQGHDSRSLEIPNTLKHDVVVYCMDLCQDILQSPAWKLVSRGTSFYPNLSTIEIACGLDALCQGYRVLLEETSTIRENYQGLEFSFAKNIDAALDFLKWSQDQIPQDSLVGKGGLGHGGYWVKEQRIDVTGHAIGAVTNLMLPQ